MATFCPRCAESVEHYHGLVENELAPLWARAKFDKLVDALQRVLAQARQKREHQIDALKRREALLDEVLEVLNRKTI